MDFFVHGVSRNEVDKKVTNFLFDIYKQKLSQVMKESLLWIMVAKGNIGL